MSIDLQSIMSAISNMEGYKQSDANPAKELIYSLAGDVWGKRLLFTARTATKTLESGEYYYEFTGYGENNDLRKFKGFLRGGAGKYPLDFLTPEEFDARMAGIISSTGAPTAYCIRSYTSSGFPYVQFDSVTDNHTITYDYWVKEPDNILRYLPGEFSHYIRMVLMSVYEPDPNKKITYARMAERKLDTLVADYRSPSDISSEPLKMNFNERQEREWANAEHDIT